MRPPKRRLLRSRPPTVRGFEHCSRLQEKGRALCSPFFALLCFGGLRAVYLATIPHFDVDLDLLLLPCVESDPGRGQV